VSTVLILTPVIIASWPAIAAAVGTAAAALGLAAKEHAKERAEAEVNVTSAEDLSIEVELEDSQALGESVGAGQEIVLTKGTIELKVRRNAKGRCVICAEGAGHTKEELKGIADEFAQKVTQCFVYNKVMSELRAKGFQVVDEEQMADESVRLHVRRWEE
jgi:hypothetical protein